MFCCDVKACEGIHIKISGTLCPVFEATQKEIE